MYQDPQRQTSVREVTTYKEVEVTQEIIIEVPRKEIVTTRKIVPKIITEVRETIVEVPRVEVVKKDVDLVQVEEVIRTVNVIKKIEVPKEVIKYVPKLEVKKIEKEVEVAGDIVEVERIVEVENHVIVPKYENEKRATVVAQKMIPILNETSTPMTVSARQYEPKVIPVDVYVPKPVYRVPRPGTKSEHYEVVVVPPAHYNALVRASNQGLTDDDVKSLLHSTSDGSIPMTVGESLQFVEPIGGLRLDDIVGLNA